MPCDCLIRKTGGEWWKVIWSLVLLLLKICFCLLSANTETNATKVDPQPSCSRTGNLIQSIDSLNKNSFLVSPELILPVPRTKQIKRTTRKRGKTTIITSSPYQKELETAQVNANQVKRKVTFGDSAGVKNKKKVRKDAKKEVAKEVSESKRHVQISSDEDKDAQCLYCQYFYSESTESWIRCSVCELWAHYSCAGIDSTDIETDFVCENCQ